MPHEYIILEGILTKKGFKVFYIHINISNTCKFIAYTLHLASVVGMVIFTEGIVKFSRCDGISLYLGG